MLVAGVAEEVQVELPVPVGHHGLVVVRPAVVACVGGVLAVGLHNLDVVHTHHRTEAAVVALGIAERGACVVNPVVGMQQVVDEALVGLEDGTVLVEYGHADLLGDVLELYEVLGEVGAEVLQLVAVVVDEPAAVHLGGRRTFHHLAREGL